MSFTQEDLQKMSVHSLREIGRNSGVKAPTSLNKSQLIQSILDIESGKVEPCCSHSRRGRPALSNKKEIEYSQYVQLKKLHKMQKLINECEKELLKIILE